MPVSIASIPLILIQQIGWTLIHFLWQGAVVALVLAGLLRTMRRCSAPSRYLAATSAMITLFACPIITVTTLTSVSNSTGQSPQPGLFETTLTAELHDVVTSEPRDLAVNPRESHLNDFPLNSVAVAGATTPPEDGRTGRVRFLQARYLSPLLQPWLPTLVSGWCLGVTICWVRLLIAWNRIQRFRTSGTPLSAGALSALQRQLQARMGMRRMVCIFESTLIEVPMVMGWLRPVILLPTTAVTGLLPIQLEAIIAHELAHVRRWDFPVNMLQNVVEAALFYHPAVWWVSSQMRQEREHCCDDIASHICGDRIDYAKALLQMEELRPPVAVAVAATSGDLLTRVQRLLLPPIKNDLPPRGLLALTAFLVVVGLATGIQLTAHESEVVEEPATSPLDLPGQLTVARVADNIELTMKQFSSAVLSANVYSVRNYNAFDNEAAPELVHGPGHFEYRSDGHRWSATEHTYTYLPQDMATVPVSYAGGFDGSVHYSVIRNFVTYGEEDSIRDRTNPGSVFWHGAKGAHWMLSALRGDDVRIVQDSIDKESGRRIVRVVCAWKLRGEQWRFELSVLPNHSWLALHSEVFVNGESVAVETIEDFAQTDDGTWYPARLKWTQKQPNAMTIRQVTKVASFLPNSQFEDGDFTYTPAPGMDIVDRRLGTAWQFDPWQPELAAWMKQQFDWPRADFSLTKITSNADVAIDGQDVPPIRVAAWRNDEEPDLTNQLNRTTTVLYFFTSPTTTPFNRELIALNALADGYKDQGLQIVGIASATNSPERFWQRLKELNVTFPVAIDLPNTDGRGHGVTYSAFGQQSVKGVFVIDPTGKVRIIDGGSENGISALENVLRSLDTGSIAVEPPSTGGRLTHRESRQIDKEWKLRAAAKRGTGVIRGKVECTAGDRSVFISSQDITSEKNGVAALITITPTMRHLNSSTPGSYRLYRDESRMVKVLCEPDGTYEIPNLCLGTYELTVAVAGRAMVEKTIVMATDNSHSELNIVLNQDDSIMGEIVDVAGKPVSGAKVRVLKRHIDPEASHIHMMGPVYPEPVTDNRGRFGFRDLRVGAYTLQVTAEGFEATDVKLVSAGRQDVRVVLTKVK